MTRTATFAFILLCLVSIARADVKLQDCPWGPELPPQLHHRLRRRLW
jgi:hypothetical protein